LQSSVLIIAGTFSFWAHFHIADDRFLQRRFAAAFIML
jgi:hypothetical protein